MSECWDKLQLGQVTSEGWQLRQLRWYLRRCVGAVDQTSGVNRSSAGIHIIGISPRRRPLRCMAKRGRVKPVDDVGDQPAHLKAGHERGAGP